MSIVIKIKGQEYLDCIEASKNMWCSSKAGFYGRGILNKQKDPHRTERLGRLGEKALSKYLKRDVNFKYVKGGDSGDLISESKIDIKTASYNYGALLIQAENEFGKKNKIKCDIYVAAICESDDGENKEATIRLVGWCDKTFIENQKMVPARVGKHKNYDIAYENLNPIETLKENFK